MYRAPFSTGKEQQGDGPPYPPVPRLLEAESTTREIVTISALAGAIGPEKAEHFTLQQANVQAVDRSNTTVSLGENLRAQDFATVRCLLHAPTRFKITFSTIGRA